MISLNNNFTPEEEFEKEEFSSLINELQNLDDLTGSPEAKEKLFRELKKIRPKKPLSLIIKDYFIAPFFFGKPVPAFAMLVIASIIFLVLPIKKVLIPEGYLGQVKYDLQFSEKNLSFEDGPEETISVFEEDTNGDGLYDVIKYDLDSDGKLDYITIDFNHDNYTDILAVDTDGDGKMDYFEYDLDYDRNFDHAGIDSTGNEISDSFYLL